jgi:hypothetical protein
MRIDYEVTKSFQLDGDTDMSSAFFNILEGSSPKLNSVFVDMDTDNQWQLMDYEPMKPKDGIQRLLVRLKAINHTQLPTVGTRFIMDPDDQPKQPVPAPLPVNVEQKKKPAPAPLPVHVEQKKQPGFWGKLFGKK